MSKVISKDDLEAYQSWQLPTVGGAKVTAPEEGQHSNMLTARQIEEVQKQAYEEAYALGVQEGREAGRKEVLAKAQKLDQLMAALAKPFAELDDKVEQEVVTLVIALVRQLVRREIRTDPGQIVAVVREAMVALPVASRGVRLHLHPEDAAVVREAFSLSDEQPGWKIIEDPVLSRGGCRVVTEDSQIDASMETRLVQLFAKVFGGERESDR